MILACYCLSLFQEKIAENITEEQGKTLADAKNDVKRGLRKFSLESLHFFFSKCTISKKEMLMVMMQGFIFLIIKTKNNLLLLLLCDKHYQAWDFSGFNRIYVSFTFTGTIFLNRRDPV